MTRVYVCIGSKVVLTHLPKRLRSNFTSLWLFSYSLFSVRDFYRKSRPLSQATKRCRKHYTTILRWDNSLCYWCVSSIPSPYAFWLYCMFLVTIVETNSLHFESSMNWSSSTLSPSSPVVASGPTGIAVPLLSCRPSWPYGGWISRWATEPYSGSCAKASSSMVKSAWQTPNMNHIVQVLCTRPLQATKRRRWIYWWRSRQMVEGSKWWLGDSNGARRLLVKPNAHTMCISVPA